MKKKVQEIAEPLEASFFETKASATTSSRGNKAASIIRTERFKNIDDGLIPFKNSTAGYGGKSNGGVDVKDAVVLCQKAYYNFAVFRNTIDLMTEFSVNDIYFEGGNKKVREFLKAYFRKINLWSLQDKFFREFYRSGNVFLLRNEASFKSEDVAKITQVFGSLLAADKNVKLPVKYSILNPADIILGGNINFSNGRYYKVLSDYELERLRNPQSDEDKEVLKSLSPEELKLINQKNAGIIYIPLQSEKFIAVFYKKQDYEPFAVPMGYPVLEDINAKAELRKMDMAIARTMQQAILLVTAGSEPEKGGVNKKNLEVLQKIFNNQSVGRVLIADYTTKAQFVIPQISDILDPKKYEVLDKDIQNGLSSILVGDQKFANESIKVKVFIERLKQAREVFINEFLTPEIKRICKALGFKSYPEAKFDDIDLKDEVQYGRVYSRMMELGVLTPEEGLEAMQTGRLPKMEDSIESQKAFKALKDEGLYNPLIGGKGPAAEAGRPGGTTQIKQTVPRNAAASEKVEGYSITKIKDLLLKATNLENEVIAQLLVKEGKQKANKKLKDLAGSICETIVANEDASDWVNSIEEYLKNPVDKNQQRVNQVYELAAAHDLDVYTASILLSCK
jgi:hypothetical protein